MGTRNLTMVKIGCKIKVAQYGQWDGYPGGQGATIVDFLKNPEIDLNLFKKKVRKCSGISKEELRKQYIDAGDDPKNESGMINMTIADEHKRLYPHMSRDTGGKILEMIYKSENGLRLFNSLSFVKDSLFCEWAYLVDLNNNTLEVYVGFQHDPLSDDQPFAYLNKKCEREWKKANERHIKQVRKQHKKRVITTSQRDETIKNIIADDKCYYPISRIAVYTFDELKGMETNEWVKRVGLVTDRA